MFKRIIFLLLYAPFALGQLTQVSGTVKDPNGLPYSNGTITATLVISGTPRFTFNSLPYTPPSAPVGLDATGSFVMSLADVNQLTPSGGTWSFHVCSATGTVQPGSPITAGPVCFDAPGFIITGAAVNISTQLSLVAPKLTAPGIGGGGTGPAGAGGGSPSSAYTIFPSTSPTCASGSYSPTGTTFCAQNNITGAIDFSGTDAAPVIQSAINARATIGGRYFFKIGVYNFNSMTLESQTGCSNFQGSGSALAYGIGIPSSPSSAASVQWIFDGETTPIWLGESQSTTVNTAGVLFNVTPAAVSSVAAGSVLVGMLVRPVSGCAFSVSNVSNDVAFSTMGIRFPTNQRGNTIGIAAWYAINIYYFNVLADFAQTYNVIATGSAPVVGSYNSLGLTSTVSGSGNAQRFIHTYVTGYNICYDWQSEHVVSTNSSSIYCNVAAYIGRAGGLHILHPIVIEKFSDQENLQGMILGPNMVPGSRVDMIGLDIELGVGNWYARTLPGYVETNTGNTFGTVTYTVGQQNGANNLGFPALFSTGGTNFTVNPTVQSVGLYDTFSRPNSATLGNQWFQNWTGFVAGQMGITNNTATPQTAAVAWAAFVGQTMVGSDQFSKATVATMDTSGNFAGVLVNMVTAPANKTYYQYLCAGTAAGGSQIIKVFNGAATTLASQTSVIGCNANDTIEIRNLSGVIYAIRNGVLDNNLSPNPVADSSIIGGQPAIVSTATTISLSNWTGGNLPWSSAPAIYLPQVHALAALPVCSVNTEGLHAVATNLNAACSAGGTPTGGGTTHCELYCNGTTYLETGR